MNNNTIKDNMTILDRVTYAYDVSNSETNKTYTVEARGWHAEGTGSADYMKMLVFDQLYLKTGEKNALGVGMDMEVFVAEPEMDNEDLFVILWHDYIVDKLPDMLKRLEASMVE